MIREVFVNGHGGDFSSYQVGNMVFFRMVDSEKSTVITDYLTPDELSSYIEFLKSTLEKIKNG